MTKNILKKYNLVLESTPLHVRVRSLNPSTDSEKLLHHFFFFLGEGHEGFYFNLLEFIKQITLIRSGYKEKYIYDNFQVENYRILVKEDKVYLGYRDDDEEWFLNYNVYKTISIEEFEELLGLIFEETKKHLTDRQRLLEKVKFKLDQIVLAKYNNMVNVNYYSSQINLNFFPYYFSIKIETLTKLNLLVYQHDKLPALNSYKKNQTFNLIDLDKEIEKLFNNISNYRSLAP